MKLSLFRSDKPSPVIKTCNMDLRDETIKPSPRQIRINGAAWANNDPCPTIIRWTHGGLPAAWFGQYLHLKYCQEGAVTNADTVAGTFTDICRFEDGSGNAAIIGCYGNSDYIDSFDSAATSTSSTTTKVVLATMCGPHLYGVTDLGAYSTYKVSKCPAGSSPLTATNWSDGSPVGSPMYPINSLRAIGSSPVVGKPEGLFVWDDTANEYVNRMEYEFAVHMDNGKGMFAGKRHVFFPTADGGLIKFDGYSVEDIGPKLSALQHRDNPHMRARITTGCVAGDWVYVVTAPWELGWTQEFGLKVYTYDSSATNYTDITTNTTDGKLSTVGAVGGLGDLGDFIYVGADIPFEAVKFVIGTANTDTRRFSTCETYSAITDSWVSNSCSRIDGTRQNVKSLAKDGYIRVLGANADYGAHSVMTPTATPGLTKYWARFALDGALSAETTLAEIFILPSRPPICSGTFSNSGGTIAVANGSFEYTGPDAAGMYPHVLAGHEVSDGWKWYDIAVLQVYAPVAAMAYMELDTGQAEENAGPRLVMTTQGYVSVLMLGKNPRISSPVNENYTDGVQMGTPIVYLAPTDLSGDNADRSTERDTVIAYEVYGEYVDSDDTLTVFQRFDHNSWDKVETANTAPARMKAPSGNQGLVLEIAIAYEDPSIQIAGPSISRIDVEFEEANLAFDATPQGDAVTPERE
jgi:hypothetical protein